MDPFALLGLSPAYNIDRDDLERRYRDLQRALHPDRHTQAPATERRMTLSKAVEVNAAYRVLKDDLQRAEALVKLRGVPAQQQPADPGFLITIMELREALSEAKAANDLDAVRSLAKRVERDGTLAQERFAQQIDQEASAETNSALANTLSELKYYRRFLDEVAVIEDEALSLPDAGQDDTKARA